MSRMIHLCPGAAFVALVGLLIVAALLVLGPAMPKAAVAAGVVVATAGLVVSALVAPWDALGRADRPGTAGRYR